MSESSGSMVPGVGSRVVWHGLVFRHRLDEAWVAAMTRGAMVFQRDIKRNFGSEGGRVVGKTKTGRNKYKAARPGRFPGIRTGRLRRSISYVVTRDSSKGRTVAKVGTNVKYGYWLELMKRKRLRRPWARRTFGMSRKFIGSAIFRELARQMERGST